MVQTLSPAVKVPPVADGLPFLGNVMAFIAARGLPVDFFIKTQQRYGDVVQLKVMNRSFYLISDPDLIREVLVKQVQTFDKPEAMFSKPQGLSRFLGKSVLTASYHDWRPQRKLIQPFMHIRHIIQYAESMGEMGARLVTQWEDGAVRDIHADMIKVTMWIVTKTMFGIDTGNNDIKLENVANDAQALVIGELVSMLPDVLKQREKAAEKINDTLTEIVRTFIADYQTAKASNPETQTERNDLLSLLVETRDEDGNPLSEEFVRNNILTMFFAGHETTANTLTWAFYYLAKYPEILAQLQAEVDSVLAVDQVPTLADLEKLPYTAQVIKETLRIRPTVGTIPRYIKTDTELGGYQLKGGSLIFMSPYVMHRLPQYWDAPETFDPSRFTPEKEAEIDKHVYFPFGGGPRTCAGNHFAMMEAQILLALFVRNYRLHLVSDAPVEITHHLTSFPKHGLPMRLERRH